MSALSNVPLLTPFAWNVAILTHGAMPALVNTILLSISVNAVTFCGWRIDTRKFPAPA